MKPGCGQQGRLEEMSNLLWRLDKKCEHKLGPQKIRGTHDADGFQPSGGTQHSRLSEGPN